MLLFAFAYLFLAIQEIYPASFTAFDGPGRRSFLELIYFSGANLTSVGLSDVTAIKPLARSVTTVEQLGACSMSRWSSRVWWLSPCSAIADACPHAAKGRALQ